MQNRVLITGAAGFVGRATVEEFKRRGWLVRALLRSASPELGSAHSVEYVVVGDICAVDNWSEYCRDCFAVVHLAARAHKVNEAPTDKEQIFERVNCTATANLAEGAAASGVKRFVYVSSAGVMGDFSRKPFTEHDAPAPASTYTKSKLKAEILLNSICSRTSMELTILRPTLIYGAGNPGNLYRLLKLVKIGIPLPFGSIRDKRSLLNVSNFADVIARVVIAPNAANRVFLVSDGEDISTSQLVRSLGVSVGRRVVLFPFPKSILRLLAAAFGKTRDMEKILGSFQVDNSLLRDALGLQNVSTKGYLEKNRIG